jgi:uncharacterized protein (DUF2062 family)
MSDGVRQPGGFLQDKLLQPIIELLRQGVTPEKMALSLALGVALGVFPALGWTTALCAIAAVLLRLNLPAVQIVNYFVYPLQIALLIPFFRLGERLFRAPHLAISAPQIYAMMHTSMGDAIRRLWATTWHAMVVWCLVAPLGVAALYVILLPPLRRLLRKQTISAAEAA